MKEVFVLSNSWCVFLSARFNKKEPSVPEPVFGPHGSIVDERATVNFEIKVPASGLWRSADRAYPGEEFRVAFRSIGTQIKASDLRKEHEQSKKEMKEIEEREKYRRLEANLERLIGWFFWLVVVFAGKAGFDIGLALFELWGQQ